MYQSTKKLRQRGKRLKGLFHVEGLEMACLREVPFNGYLTNKENHSGTDLRDTVPSRGNSVYKGYRVEWPWCTGEIGHTRYRHHAGRVRDSENGNVT